MKKPLLLTLTLLFSFAFIANAQEGHTLDERWVLSPKAEQNKKMDDIEVEFFSDGTYKLKGMIAGKDYIDENGTYVWQPHTDEIFVTVDECVYDYPVSSKEPIEYNGLVFSDYQTYYKIEKREGSAVYVTSCRALNVRRSATEQLWEKDINDIYHFIQPKTFKVKKEEYTRVK